MKIKFILVSIFIMLCIETVSAMKEIDLETISRIKTPENQYNLAMYYYSTQEYEKSLGILKDLYSNYPKNLIYRDNTLYWMGIIYTKLKDLNNAQIIFQEYINSSEYKNFYIESLVCSADILYNQSKFDAALTRYLSALLPFMNSDLKSYIFFQTGLCYIALSKYYSALESFNMIVENYPESLEYDKSVEKITFIKNRLSINNQQNNKNNFNDSILTGKNDETQKYVIQVGGFRYSDNAEVLKKKLNKTNIPAYIIKEGTLYKVRIGFFKTREEASSYLKNKIALQNINAIILPLN